MRLRIRVLLHALRKPSVPPLKRREAERRQAHHWFPPRRRKKACQRMRRALCSLPAPHWRGIKGAARSPFGAPPRSCAEGLTSTRLRAALPGITGSKREDPLRHQCSQHLAVRSRAGRSMPRTARIEVTSPIREPRPPHRSAVTGRRPFDGRAGGYVTVLGTTVKTCPQSRDSVVLERRGAIHRSALVVSSG